MEQIKSINFRNTTPDFVYNSNLVSKFINKIMISGKKALAEKIFYNAIENVINLIKSGEFSFKLTENEENKYKIKSTKDITPNELIELSVLKVCCDVEIVSQRVGGSNYKIPKPIPLVRSVSIALKWIADAVKSRNERTAIDKLSAEIMDILLNKGEAIKRKTEIEKNAEANKAFAHFLKKK